MRAVAATVLIGATLLGLAPLRLEAADEATGFGPSALEWGRLPDLPDAVGLAGPYAGTSGEALVVAGGANFPDRPPWQGGTKVWHDRIYVLSSREGPWIEAPRRLPRPLAYGVSLAGDDALVCLGGSDAERHRADAFLIRWDAERGRVELESLPPLPQPAAHQCGAILGERIYLAGGLAAPDAGRPLEAFWTLDLSKQGDERAWEELKTWPGPPRMLAAAGVQDGAFYLFGGVDLVPHADGDPRREYLGDAYRFEPDHGWSRIADLPQPSAAAPSPAPALGQSHLLLLGGDDGEHADRVAELGDRHPGFPRQIWAYHTITDTWVRAGAVPRDPAEGLWPPVTVPTVRWQGSVVVPSGEARPGVRTAQVLAAEPIARASGFRGVDFAVIGLYMAALVLMGVFFARRGRSTDDFFLAGRRIPWWAAGLSIFGTQLSAITYMAMPALVYRTDWSYLFGNMMMLVAAPVVVAAYLPIYRRQNLTTAYEYLERRFHLSVRLLGAAAFCLFQLGRMGVILLLPALALATVTGIDVYYCILVMGIVATAYTVLGGIEAVVWTDVLQAGVLLGGAVLSLLVIFGGVEGGLAGTFQMAESRGKLSLGFWSWDFATAAIWVILFGRLLEMFVPYTADQTVVQRYLTTPDEKQAARGVWTNALLSVPATLIFFSVGTGLWAFYRTRPELLNPAGRTDDIFAWFIAQQLPVGISGLVIAGLFAAAMSSLDSSMNSVATVLVTDFYRRFRPAAADRGALRLARALTLLLGVLGTGSAVWMALRHDPSMWDQHTKIVGLLGGGMAGLFALGVFTRRANALGAVVGLAASTAILYAVQRSGRVHFFLYSAVAIGSCFAIGWAASWLAPPPASTRGLTWPPPSDKARGAD